MEKEYVFVGRAQLKTRDYIKNLERENKILNHNWNELKKWLEEKLNNNKGSIDGKLTTGEYIELQLVWFKMKELEDGDNNGFVDQKSR